QHTRPRPAQHELPRDQVLDQLGFRRVIAAGGRDREAGEAIALELGHREDAERAGATRALEELDNVAAPALKYPVPAAAPSTGGALALGPDPRLREPVADRPQVREQESQHDERREP